MGVPAEAETPAEAGPRWAMGSGSRTFRAVVHGDFVSVKMVKHAWSGRVPDYRERRRPNIGPVFRGERSLLQNTSREPENPAGRTSGRRFPTQPAAVSGWWAPRCSPSIEYWTIWRRSGNAGGTCHEKQCRGSWLRNIWRRASDCKFACDPCRAALASCRSLGRLRARHPLRICLSIPVLLRIVLRNSHHSLAATQIARHKCRKIAGNGPRAYWATAIGVSATAATVLVALGEDGLNKQMLYWVKVLIQTTSSQRRRCPSVTENSSERCGEVLIGSR